MPNFVSKRGRQGLRQFLRAGDHELERRELCGIDALHVATQESWRGEEDVDLMEGDEFGQALGFKRARIGHQVHALDDGEPKRDRAAEGVEKRQASEDRGAARQVETAAKLADIREDIAVAERDTLGLAGGTGGEKQGGLFVAAALVQAEDDSQHA